MEEFKQQQKTETLPVLEKEQAVEQIEHISNAFEKTATVGDIIGILQDFKDKAPVVNGEPVLFYESSIAGIEDQFLSYDTVIAELQSLAEQIPVDKNYILTSGGSSIFEDEETEDNPDVKVIDISLLDSSIPPFVLSAVLDIIDV